MLEAWRTAVADGVDAGELRGDVDPRVFQELVHDAVWYTSRWNTGEHARSSEDLADAIIAVFVEGMRAR